MTGSLLSSFPKKSEKLGHKSMLTGVCFGHEDDYLFTSSSDKEALKWEIEESIDEKKL
jgi:WD40 repeat protein